MFADAHKSSIRPSSPTPRRGLGRTDVSFDLPVVSPILVGRGSRLSALERVLGEVADGRGQTVLIAGEAGIGKSRLVAQTRAWAEQRGFTTLEGLCDEPDRVLPYAPFLDLLCARIGSRPPDDLALEFGSAAPEFVKLIPELASLRPGLAATALGPVQEKHRFFHAFDRYLVGLAAARPTLVVVEDLHWSDEASLDLLLYLSGPSGK